MFNFIKIDIFPFLHLRTGMGFITGGQPGDPGQRFGGSGGSGGGGGGTGGGTSAPANLANLPVTGGLSGAQAAFLYIGFDFIANQNLVYSFNSNNFNSEEDVEYDFKVEEIEPGNQLTIHRIVLRYRDLGPVTFTVAIVSADLPGIDYTPLKGNATLINVGNAVPTNKIFTKKVDLKVTTEAPQIKILRSANAGPLDLTKVKAWGSYGDGDII